MPTTFWIVIQTSDFKLRAPIPSQRFGPYESEQAAEAALPDLLPWDTADHVYEVRIEPHTANPDE
ncbi:MAG TPA: hypothetical protein VGF59_22080 [Bryobacteraceae bacterium]|jgi:hypothetical protein